MPGATTTANGNSPWTLWTRWTRRRPGDGRRPVGSAPCFCCPWPASMESMASIPIYGALLWPSGRGARLYSETALVAFCAFQKLFDKTNCRRRMPAVLSNGRLWDATPLVNGRARARASPAGGGTSTTRRPLRGRWTANGKLRTVNCRRPGAPLLRPGGGL
jgi:hypothetical protein